MDFANYWFSSGSNRPPGPDPGLIGNSLRFRNRTVTGGDRYSKLNRTVASDGNRRTWTWSTWLKMTVNNPRKHCGVMGGGNQNNGMQFYVSDGGNEPNNHRWDINAGGIGSYTMTTGQYRDPTAWYHFVWRFDSTQSTSANRERLYINGVQVPVSRNRDFGQNGVPRGFNAAGNEFYIGVGAQNNNNPFAGYLAENHFVDGSSLDPTSFGEFSDDGVWRPIQVTGLNYGTNGFYLDFSDPADLGADRSGRGNNFTATNFDLNAASQDYDWMEDSPTNCWAIGNILAVPNGRGATWGNGYLWFDNRHSGGDQVVMASQVLTQDTYWEAEIDQWSGNAGEGIGVSPIDDQDRSNNLGRDRTNILRNQSSLVSGLPSIDRNGSVLGFRWTQSTKTLAFYRNNVLEGSFQVPDTSKEYVPACPVGGGITEKVYWNFGQKPFKYDLPAGFSTLSTAIMPDVAITNPSEHCKAITYQGNGSTLSVGGLDFSPDFVWIKNRTAGNNHQLFDVIRGPGKTLYSNLTDKESTNQSSGYLTSFDDNGFTVTGSGGDVNANDPYVAWCWNAGDGAPASNTNGTVTSTVKANQEAGFSIVSWPGNTTNNTRIGHGLSQAPELIIFKSRDNSRDWPVYAEPIGIDKILYLNKAYQTGNAGSGAWGSEQQPPNSTVFSVGTSIETNDNGPMIAYCWHSVPGYSSIGSYRGNSNSDGPFIYTGFRPGWIMLKVYSGQDDDWFVWDTARDTYNVTYKSFKANYFQAEQTDASNTPIDIVANGFKIRSSGTNINGNGHQFIYMAFAEHPFGGANVSPSPAR